MPYVPADRFERVEKGTKGMKNTLTQLFYQGGG